MRFRNDGGAHMLIETWVFGKPLLLPWAASAEDAPGPQKNYRPMMLRLVSAQLLEVVVLAFIAYGISRPHWFKANE
jgi:hypothetical protein